MKALLTTLFIVALTSLQGCSSVTPVNPPPSLCGYAMQQAQCHAPDGTVATMYFTSGGGHKE